MKKEDENILWDSVTRRAVTTLLLKRSWGFARAVGEFDRTLTDEQSFMTDVNGKKHHMSIVGVRDEDFKSIKALPQGGWRVVLRLLVPHPEIPREVPRFEVHRYEDVTFDFVGDEAVNLFDTLSVVAFGDCTEKGWCNDPMLVENKTVSMMLERGRSLQAIIDVYLKSIKGK
jgi:hypothetical protein